MLTGINLTPPQEIKRQKTQYIVGTSIKTSLLLFAILLAVAGFLFYKSSRLKSQLTSLDQQKTDFTAQKDSMKEVEEYSKKLSGKYFLLQKYLQSRVKYSAVLTELLARVPENVVLESIGFEGSGKKARITGSSKDLVDVSTLVNRFAKEGNASTESAVSLSGKNAFSEVSLDSLNVNEGKSVEYTVSFKINEENFLK
ncbi:MAG: PilN domain-containing protein [Patescibacteria group bacterium]